MQDTLTTGATVGVIIGLLELVKILVKQLMDRRANGNGSCKTEKIIELLDGLDRKFDLQNQKQQVWHEMEARHFAELSADVRDLFNAGHEVTSPGGRRPKGLFEDG